MNYKTYKGIPNALKLHRVQSGRMQKDVAAHLGLKGTALLSRWENGDSLPSLVSVIRLSLLYKTPIEVLFAGLVDSLCSNTLQADAPGLLSSHVERGINQGISENYAGKVSRGTHPTGGV